MPSFLDTYNPSILAIPAMHMLSVLPHSYALSVATGGKLAKWDNRNPRSTTMKSKLKERLDSQTYALYERLEACHANGMENLPLFAVAVVLGNLAGLKKDGLGGMTGFAASFLAIRLAYTAVYINNKTQGLTLVRSGLWAAGVGLCWRIIIKSAKALGSSKKMWF
ncbi:hypothetical protein BU24DRAFT_418663 [Aaosphaeria arxii CBS 175.79]|uniref:Membrane-associated proteins in eicosanoid and glutathione metabolism n=1 Tax=Aaosphaeria arxii CBS 175.79 TaxID=1450172 RepID=A0A6A5Y0K1_9PLEO|nr:uncharacterized protein BU24DRAFT_418663 [Aaosphaeria arxii CBS 175.79]KAF2019065.1 hypothetical protein BU24DRAFT_418663 [Aaosphaeria arxii CBS 175.79]